MGRFVFLDRDGTIIRDAGYGPEVHECAFLPGAVEGLSRLAAAGFELAILTNQSGIGRGYFDEAHYARFRDHLEAELERLGVPVVQTYHCPHAPDAGCGCRKPEPGMLLRARDELGADLAASWVIGDKASDVGLAERGGCAGGLLVGPGGGAGTVADLREAAERILAQAAADPDRSEQADPERSEQADPERSEQADPKRSEQADPERR